MGREIMQMPKRGLGARAWDGAKTRSQLPSPPYQWPRNEIQTQKNTKHTCTLKKKAHHRKPSMFTHTHTHDPTHTRAHRHVSPSADHTGLGIRGRGCDWGNCDRRKELKMGLGREGLKFAKP